MRTHSSKHISTHSVSATMPVPILPPPRRSRARRTSPPAIALGGNPLGLPSLHREKSDNELTSTSEMTVAGVTFTFRSNLKGFDRNALDCVRSVLPRDAFPSARPTMHDDSTQTDSGRKAQRTYDMIVGGGDLQVTIDGRSHRAPLSRAWDMIADDVKSTLTRCSTSHAAFRAAAVWVEDEAVLIVGRPQSGTSRFARAFDRLGYPLLAEELVLVEHDPPRVAGRRIGAVVDTSYKPDAPVVIRESGNLLDRLLPEGAGPEHLRIATQICLEARTLRMLRGEAEPAVHALLRFLRGPFHSRPS